MEQPWHVLCFNNEIVVSRFATRIFGVWTHVVFVAACSGDPNGGGAGGGPEAAGMYINPDRVQEIAIYQAPFSAPVDTPPSQIDFNLAEPSVIEEAIASIDFSVERTCSDLSSLIDGVVYIRFDDDSVEVYELLALWSHFSKFGTRGSCFWVADRGQELLRAHAQQGGPP